MVHTLPSSVLCPVIVYQYKNLSNRNLTVYQEKRQNKPKKRAGKGPYLKKNSGKNDVSLKEFNVWSAIQMENYFKLSNAQSRVGAIKTNCRC